MRFDEDSKLSTPFKATTHPLKKPVVSDFYSHGQLLSLVLRKNIGFYVLKHQVELKTEITWNDECKEFAV